MARLVHEIMNPELFRLRPQTACAEAMGDIVALGITGAPVLDEGDVPVGVVSLRDLIGPGGDTVETRMTAPADTIDAGATVDEAARALVDKCRHRLVCVDAEGRAVGVVSSVDVLAAVLGMPVRHPPGFPHIDPLTGLSWTDEALLDADHADRAPNGPGLILLVHGGAGERETPIWAEASPNVRTRLYELSSVPQSDPTLARLLDRDRAHLRFRAAAVEQRSRRDAALRKLEAEVARVSGQAPR